MEKEGLLRVLKFLEEHGLRVDILVTDRHSQINKWLRENHPEIKHYFDIWHVAKRNYYTTTGVFHFVYTGIKKKLEIIGKTKDCELVHEWIRSIVNHLYWSVSSCADGNSEEMEAKWTSLDNHVHNVHTHHSKIFKKCLHKRLTGRNRKKKWFKRRE